MVGAMVFVTDVAAIRAYGKHAIAEAMRLTKATARAHGDTTANAASGFLLVVTQEEAARLSRPTRWLRVAGEVAAAIAALVLGALGSVTGIWIWYRWRRGQHGAPAV
jgi:hypothetical protein